MTLNGTLVIQVINFCIAYFLLRWLYFKPAIALIQKEEEFNVLLKNTITEHSLVIKQNDQRRQEYWSKCRLFFKERKPLIKESNAFVTKEVTPSVQEPVYSEGALRKLSDNVIHMLTKRINHVS